MTGELVLGATYKVGYESGDRGSEGITTVVGRLVRQHPSGITLETSPNEFWLSLTDRIVVHAQLVSEVDA